MKTIRQFIVGIILGMALIALAPVLGDHTVRAFDANMTSDVGVRPTDKFNAPLVKMGSPVPSASAWLGAGGLLIPPEFLKSSLHGVINLSHVSGVEQLTGLGQSLNRIKGVVTRTGQESRLAAPAQARASLGQVADGIQKIPGGEAVRKENLFAGFYDQQAPGSSLDEEVIMGNQIVQTGAEHKLPALRIPINNVTAHIEVDGRTLKNATPDEARLDAWDISGGVMVALFGIGLAMVGIVASYTSEPLSRGVKTVLILASILSGAFIIYLDVATVKDRIEFHKAHPFQTTVAPAQSARPISGRY